MTFSFKQRKSINQAIVWLAGLTFLTPGKVTRGNRPIIFRETPEGLLLSSSSRRLLLKGDYWVDGRLSQPLEVKMCDLFKFVQSTQDVIMSFGGKIWWQTPSILEPNYMEIDSRPSYLPSNFNHTPASALTEDEVSELVNQLPERYKDDLTYLTVDLPGGNFITIPLKVGISLRLMLVNRTSDNRTVTVSHGFFKMNPFVEVCVSSGLMVQQMYITPFNHNFTGGQCV
jgi:hypothetical protein